MNDRKINEICRLYAEKKFLNRFLDDLQRNGSKKTYQTVEDVLSDRKWCDFIAAEFNNHRDETVITITNRDIFIDELKKDLRTYYHRYYKAIIDHIDA